MTQAFSHEQDSARSAGQFVDKARGAIGAEVGKIDQAVQQLRSKGWEGEAANKFYSVAAEMVAGANRLQAKMDEMRDDLQRVNASFSEASQTLKGSVDSIEYDITR